jgi:hypothetical protein
MLITTVSGDAIIRVAPLGGDVMIARLHKASRFGRAG